MVEADVHISKVWMAGRKEERKEGVLRKDVHGRTERRKEGGLEGRTKGGEEGRSDGKKERMKEGSWPAAGGGDGCSHHQGMDGRKEY